MRPRSRCPSAVRRNADDAVARLPGRRAASSRYRTRFVTDLIPRAAQDRCDDAIGAQRRLDAPRRRGRPCRRSSGARAPDRLRPGARSPAARCLVAALGELAAAAVTISPRIRVPGARPPDLRLGVASVASLTSRAVRPIAALALSVLEAVAESTDSRERTSPRHSRSFCHGMAHPGHHRRRARRHRRHLPVGDLQRAGHAERSRRRGVERHHGAAQASCRPDPEPDRDGQGLRRAREGRLRGGHQGARRDAVSAGARPRRPSPRTTCRPR